MRRVFDSLMVLMVAGVIGAVLYYSQAQESVAQDLLATRAHLVTLHDQAVYRGSLEAEASGEARDRFVRVMRPEWFGDALPDNRLVGREHPWIDLAPAGDLSGHPPDPVCDQAGQAGLWYNPSRGIFRARVPRLATERETRDLYNQVNGTAVDSVVRDPRPDRQPIAQVLGVPTPALALPRGATRDHMKRPPPPGPPASPPPSTGPASSPVSAGGAVATPVTAEPVGAETTESTARPTLRSE